MFGVAWHRPLDVEHSQFAPNPIFFSNLATFLATKTGQTSHNVKNCSTKWKSVRPVANYQPMSPAFHEFSAFKPFIFNVSQACL
jgi:hypothetical protein